METWLLSLFYPSILLTSGLQCRTLEIGADRFKVPDIMFNPSIVQVTCAKSRKLISTNVLIMLLRFKLIVSQKTFSFKFSPIFFVVANYQTIPGMENNTDMLHSVRGLPHMVWVYSLPVQPQSPLINPKKIKTLFLSTGHREYQQMWCWYSQRVV